MSGGNKNKPEKPKPAPAKAEEIDMIFSTVKKPAQKSDASKPKPASAKPPPQADISSKNAKMGKSKDPKKTARREDDAGDGSDYDSYSSSSDDDEIDVEASDQLEAAFAKKRKLNGNAEDKNHSKPQALPKFDKNDDFFDTRGTKAKQARYTEEGYRIYTDKELKMNQGGETADCPFDCKCCY